MLEWLYGIPAFILLLIGAVALIGKGSIGGMARGVTGAIPFGNAKLWAVIFIVLGLIFGGIAGATSLYSSVAASVSTASVGSSDTAVANAQAPLALGPVTALSVTEVTSTDNLTLRADPSNLQRYYVDVKYDSGAASVNGTLNVPKVGTDLEHDAGIECLVKSQSYRSETSTTDSNTYYILATTTAQSKVSGYTWAQTAYLNDGSVATTSSNSEKTILTFPRGTAQRTLGFYYTLPGATAFGYLNNQTSKTVDIECGGQKVYQFVITKLAA